VLFAIATTFGGAKCWLYLTHIW